MPVPGQKGRQGRLVLLTWPFVSLTAGELPEGIFDDLPRYEIGSADVRRTLDVISRIMA